MTERLDPVNGVEDNPNVHDVLTGSRPDGAATPDEAMSRVGTGRRAARAARRSGITIAVG